MKLFLVIEFKDGFKDYREIPKSLPNSALPTSFEPAVFINKFSIVSEEEMLSMMFDCKDCGKNTSDIGEYYMVTNDVWLQAVPEDYGMLCIKDLEKRLGRKLTANDFTDCALNEDNKVNGSALLKKRMNV